MGRRMGLSLLKQDCDRGMRGAFGISFYVFFWKQENSAFHSKLLKQGCLNSAAGSLQPPSFQLVPQLGSLMSQSFTSLIKSPPKLCSCCTVEPPVKNPILDLGAIEKIPQAGQTGDVRLLGLALLMGQKGKGQPEVCGLHTQILWNQC